MKKKDFLWSLLAIMMAATMSISLLSCGDDDPDPELSVDKTSISLKANGGMENISVSASHTDWNASVTDGATWLKVNKNGQLATITVDANNTTQKRTSVIKIEATEDSKLSYSITVSQEGAEGEITVSIGSVEFEPEGGTQTIQVTSNSEWSASSSQGWLTVNPNTGSAPTSGKDTKNVTLTASENSTKDARSSILSFTTKDGKSATVTVNQKKPNPFVLVNGLESTSLQFGYNGGVNYKQTVKISSNVSWSMTGVPDWLSVSPTNGNGDLNIDIYPKTDNDAEDKERTAQLTLTAGDTRATIRVSQDTYLDAGASVKPKNIVRLYNGIAFDYEFGNNVSYYYRGYMERARVASMTDAEIVMVLEQNFNRYVLADNELAVFSGLDEGVNYMIYTVGYNKKGVRGKLYKTEFSTQTLKNNEPVAWISEPTTDGSNWNWNVEKSATCYSYYMLSTFDIDFGFAPDVYQAWLMDYYVRTNQITEYVNGGDWYASGSSPFIAIMTWGLDKNGNYSNRIHWNYGISSSSARNKVHEQSKIIKIDKNYPIIKTDKLKVFKRK